METILSFEEFKAKIISEKLSILNDDFGKIYTFIDFGNVNFWFEDDNKDTEGNALAENMKLNIDLKKLADFCRLFSDKTRFYYGLNPENKSSLGFISFARQYFGKYYVFSKPLQKIKHYLSGEEAEIMKDFIAMSNDYKGNYLPLSKCNFDVEISVDAIRLCDDYDTFCLFSSDADFIALFEYLKKQRKKKIILVKSGFAQYQLIKIADKVINAQDIKQHIVSIKQKSSQKG